MVVKNTFVEICGERKKYKIFFLNFNSFRKVEIQEVPENVVENLF